MPTPSLRTAFPVLTVADLPAAIAFYRDVLDFEVAWEWGDPVVRVGVARDGIELQLDLDPTGERPVGGGTIYFHLDGVEDYYRACLARGAEPTFELAERPWGMRDFRVVDPSGNRLGFGEPTGAR